MVYKVWHFKGNGPMGCYCKFLSVTQRWQQHGNLPTTSFCFSDTPLKCPDNKASGISMVKLSKSMWKTGHERKSSTRNEMMKDKSVWRENAIRSKVWHRWLEWTHLPIVYYKHSSRLRLSLILYQWRYGNWEHHCFFTSGDFFSTYFFLSFWP